jgi:hypothetical protein
MNKNGINETATLEEVLALWVFDAIDPNLVVGHLLQLIHRQQEMIRTLSPDHAADLIDVDGLANTIARFRQTAPPER